MSPCTSHMRLFFCLGHCCRHPHKVSSRGADCVLWFAVLCRVVLTQSLRLTAMCRCCVRSLSARGVWWHTGRPSVSCMVRGAAAWAGTSSSPCTEHRLPPPPTHTHARVRTHIFHRLSVHCMHNFTATTALNPPVFSFLTCPCSAFGTPLLCSTAAGVLNTDNMSILGVTIDYGPYGFMDTFDPRYTPNTTDFSGRRYCYQNQPGAAQ